MLDTIGAPGDSRGILLRWGTSETAVNNTGQTPPDQLGDPLRSLTSCPAATVERVRVLLAGAPADRAWRRRCWLVMLRSRAEREQMRGIGGNNSGQRKRTAVGARREGRISAAA